VDAGAHVLAIKDMAGLLRPQAAHQLVGALRSRFDLPVHVHTHDTPGGQLATYVAAWQVGASAVDGASGPLAGTTSQPALSSIVAAAAHTEYDTGLSLSEVCDLEPYWEALRKVYAPFESGIPGPTGRVYRHEIPGGQLSNLRQQAIALGLGDQFEEIEANYAAADRVLGRLVKVTPSSKVVGDLALALVGAGVSADEFAADPAKFDIPDSVIGFLRGELGDPPGGWPEPLRTKALAGRPPAKPQQDLSADDETVLTQAGPKRQAALNRLLFPGPTKEFEAHRETYGDTSSLSANQFFYGLRHGEEHQVRLERGVELLIGLEAVSEPDERGMRTVMCILNGQLRPVVVRDRSIASDIPAAEKADRSNPDHIAAPFAGVVTVSVADGDKVDAGQTIATIEAMKMEAAITAPKAGTVSRIAVSATAQVEGGDLLMVVS
jgi:pyruvate carboxylase